MSKVVQKPKPKIKQYKTSTLNEEHFQSIWDLLKNAIEKIHANEASNLSFEELYRNAYNMVLHKKGDMLYNNLQTVITEHLQLKASIVAKANEADFLASVQKIWDAHTVSMQMIRDILMYMDRTHVQQNKLPTVYELGLQLFRDVVCRSSKLPIKQRLLDSVLGLVTKERQGETIDRGLVKATTEMLIHLGVDNHEIYVDDFEKPFLDFSAEFYALESQTFLLENDASVYLKKVEKRLKEEEQRVDHYLDPSTKEKIQRIVERELIYNKMKRVLEMENTGIVPMLTSDRIDDLSRMYRLLGRVTEGLEEMRRFTSTFIIQCGQKINDDPSASADATVWVQQVIELKAKFDVLLDKAFDKDKNFQTTINDGFKKFICLNAKAPEFVSLFIDDMLKKGLKGLQEEEVDSFLDKAIMLFRFLEDKDVFERYYKNHLAKRLLAKRSISDDAERTMIAKLKSECGYQFTSKLEGMFTDMRLSDDLMTSFKEFCEMNPTPIDLNVTVLTMTFWPLPSNPPKCVLPSEVLQSCESFQRFYFNRHTGRRLTWQSNMGTADVRGRFGKKIHELNVTTIAMSVLMLFNNHDTISFKDIITSLDANDADLKKNLQSLACGKYKVLTKNPKGREVEDSDSFTFNSGFTAPLTRLKIQMIASRPENEQEATETQEKVEEDRKHQIEACVVRIMKSRKRLDHNNLVTEVTKQLSNRFLPNPAIIKKRIENLIDREYLERSKEDLRVYNYLA